MAWSCKTEYRILRWLEDNSMRNICVEDAVVRFGEHNEPLPVYAPNANDVILNAIATEGWSPSLHFVHRLSDYMNHDDWIIYKRNNKIADATPIRLQTKAERRAVSRQAKRLAKQERIRLFAEERERKRQEAINKRHQEREWKRQEQEHKRLQQAEQNWKIEYENELVRRKIQCDAQAKELEQLAKELEQLANELKQVEQMEPMTEEERIANWNQCVEAYNEMAKALVPIAE